MNSLPATAATPVLLPEGAATRDATAPTEGGGRFKPSRRGPDISFCRARLSGLGDHVDCLAAYPGRCPHSLYFGTCCFCLHPQRKEIAALTEDAGHEGSAAGHFSLASLT